ncbi:MAG TPA: hypothetical protein VEZ90_09270, partial [Blastocatellia bacterium]|nr:hypothetical protein [Blastocatellia bacterium]
MTIALFGSESVLLQSVASSLANEPLDVRVLDFDSLRDGVALGPEVSKGVLIVSKHGAGEPTELVNRMLTSERRLILCAPQPDNEGCQLLRELGATEIITPRSWAPEQVAERILAQLILDGDITPSDCGSIRGAGRAMRELY